MKKKPPLTTQQLREKAKQLLPDHNPRQLPLFEHDIDLERFAKYVTKDILDQRSRNVMEFLNQTQQ